MSSKRRGKRLAHGQVSRRMAERRRNRIIEAVAAVLSQWDTSRFQFEASCRTGLRSALCMNGWPWAVADREAADLVESALRRIGAERPSWKEGQPEWTQDGALPIERENCLRCRRPLPDGHWKFCGRLCAKAWRYARMDRDRIIELSAQRAAQREAWSAQQPMKACRHCGIYYRPRWLSQKYCGQSCSALALSRGDLHP